MSQDSDAMPANPPPDRPAPRKKRLALVAAIIAVAAVVAVADGISSRAQNNRNLATWANAQAVPTVALVTPTPNAGTLDVTLPGTIQAYNTAPIYARVSGYVHSWESDIGAKVTKGQELAQIDTPDLDQQTLQAQANLVSAVVADKLSTLTSTRWQALLGYQTVSRQAADEKATDALAKQAAVQAAQANVRQLQVLQGYRRITAPFDGVVTARATDIGALVNAGSASGPALFQISDLHKVRIYVQMPQAYASDLEPGLNATLAMPQFPGKSFNATVVTTSNSFAEASRTVQVELQTDNPDGKLWPGTYTEVTFHIPADSRILRVPATALVFGSHGMQVATLGANDKVVFKPVQLGRDLGNDAEVLSGISATDRVILSPPEWLSNGDAAKAADTAETAAVASARPPVDTN
jgi:RND family efflux transporter MFP subunit